MPPRSPRTDEQRAEFIKNFRPFRSPIPIPEAGICDEPCSVYRINNDWRKLLVGLFHVLDQPDIWDSQDADEIFAVRQQVREFIAMSPCSCQTGGVGTVLDVTQNAILNNQLEDLFDAGGLDAIAPDRPNTSFSEDTGDDVGEAYRREVALCWAVLDYVTTVVEKGIFNALVSDTAILLNTGVISFLVSPIGGLIYRFAVQVAEELINLVANDPALIEAVACCMFDGLKGKTITEANFAASLDNCGFGFLSDEAIVMDAVKSGLGNTGNFLALVAVLGGYMNTTDLLGDCPCQPPVCVSDFTIDEGGWLPRLALALYTDGVGWDNSPSGANNERIEIIFEHDVDWAVSLVRVKIDNDELEDITLQIVTFDEFGVVAGVVNGTFAPGQTAQIVAVPTSSAIRDIVVKIWTTDFPDNNINAFITRVDVLEGDCVFPTQPVS